MIRWVFLDVGNILLDEDPIGFVNVRVHWEAVRQVRPGLTFLDFLGERERRSSAGSSWPLFDVVSHILDPDACTEAWRRAEREVRARYAELSPTIAGAEALVARLSRRYRLGLIANQGRECRETLAERGLLDRFEIVALSEERGLYKPDPALFRDAIELAGVAPAECVMVGDRLDNDVAPASRLGLRTVWVRWPVRAAKGWRPDDPDALAWRDSLERSSAASARKTGIRPSLAVDEIGDLGDALDHFDGSEDGLHHRFGVEG